MRMKRVIVERQVSESILASLEPFDECCWRLSIKENGKEIESGIWCPQSLRLVIDGDVVGFAKTQKELLKNLSPIQITRWVLD